MADNFVDQNGFRNWLGGVGRAILGKSSQKFNFNRNYQPANAKAILLDTSLTELMKVAVNVPHLNIVISEGAKMFSNMEIRHVNKDGVDIENSDILKLLNNPNPIQNLEAFLYDYYVNNAIYSGAICYKNKSALSKIPNVLWWLPTGYIQVNLTGKMFRQFKIEDIIESYFLFQYNEKFEPSEIIHITEGIGQTILKPTSKIEVLQIPLSNIVAALKSNNIILTERGMIGFISKDNSDSAGMGQLRMSPDEEVKVRAQYNSDNSLDSDRSHVGVFSGSLKWTPMTFDVSQLKLYEGLEDSFGLCCAAWGMDRDIFPSTKGATNENKEAGEKKTYNSTMLPLGKKLCRVFEQDFGLREKGEKLLCSFSHLPIMQEDKLKEGQAKSAVITGLSKALADGVIDHLTYATEAELPLNPNGTITGDGEIKQQNSISINTDNATKGK